MGHPKPIINLWQQHSEIYNSNQIFLLLEMVSISYITFKRIQAAVLKQIGI